ncbi:MAG: bifunctional diaminohydroxyphosphoribosylaminopyrimidine deaminase/5-amino-6-(5-phosphoribosylamino)uracil reductase RibD [Desulfobacterales bacterium]|nr:bifunctional diaminohydroxyphosphoribosylaminopyrimidine deaminase/5-amino-6-(5-phosphoribosylamino)uracil reductase RibD [Desulfobacterales bacterium]
MDDRYYMNIALELAEKGRGFTSPNPMVGAVVVRDGKIVGKGFHEAAGRPHAEVNAIDDAGEHARGATIYVTLEPCNHTGRTPPCTEKILSAGVRRVVMAMKDPNPDVQGGGAARLRERGVEVVEGLCELEAERLNEAFIKYSLVKLPFVLLKCASTLDGRIAARSGDARWVTGPASRKFVHRLRHAMDAILVGVGTVKADDPSLTTRLPDGEGCDPIRIILDTHLSIPENARLLRLDSDAGAIIVAGDAIDMEKKARLEAAGAQVIQSPVKEGVIDPAPLMETLGAMGVASLLIEGGGAVIASMLKSSVVDKINLFYAPKFLGGDDGVPICRGPGPELMRDCMHVKSVTVHRIGVDVMIEGYL